MIEANLKDAETKMHKSLEALGKEILTIRTGRASPSLVDKIPVEYYGNPTPLNQLATITVPEPRLILIQPWDRTIISAVEKAIQKSELGLNPGNDGQLIRVPIPPLNEERRREYARLVKRYAEGAHVAVRNIRREQVDRVKSLEKEKKISADEAHRGGDQLQKLEPKSWRSSAQIPQVSQLPPPEHVAIIMDGNSRWARERLLPRVMGHKAGIEAIRRVAEAADKRGIRVLTLYAFSTENWSRPRDEVDALMNLFSETIRREVDELAERGIELRFSGRLQDLSAPLQEQMRQANERTRVSGRAILNIAINYGGRQEIIDAIHELANEGADLTQLDEVGLASHLYTRGLPDPDLVIRTAGEMRLSNFLLWQAAYSEFYSTQTLWPDFGGTDFDEALASYQRRVRRFGARPEEVSNRGR